MPDQSQLESFMKLFAGRTDVYGTFDENGVRQEKAPVTPELYRLHLEGKKPLGIYMLRDDGLTQFAAVDIDEKKFEYAAAIRQELFQLDINAYICESKSKGFHVYIFASEPVVAKDIRYILLTILGKLKISAEVFPKQDVLDEKIKYGNFINLPCYGDTRHLLNAKQEVVQLEQALPLIKPIDQTLLLKARETLPPEKPKLIAAKPDLRVKKGKKNPPCIQAILNGVNQGCRDEAAFALARHLLDQGYTEAETLTLMLAWDAKNRPPIGDERIIQTKIESASKGYAFGCASIQEEPLLCQYCPGEVHCTWLKEVNEQKKKEGLLVETSFKEDGDIIYEEIIENPGERGLAKPVFVSYNTKNGQIDAVKDISIGEIKYVPIYSEEIQLGAVLMPTGVEEYTKTEYLIKEIKDHISTYADISEMFREWCAWYVLMTWIYDRLPAVSYLRFLGDFGCIKGDSRVSLGNGTLREIAKLGNNHLQDINIKLRIKGQKGALTAPATKFHKYLNAPVMELVTESGKKLTGTYNERVIIKRVINHRVENCWVRLDEIKVGDLVKVATHLENNVKATCGVEYASLLGYLIGDGFIRKNRNSGNLYIADTEAELVPPLTDFIKKTLNIQPTLQLRKARGKNRTVDMHILEFSGKNMQRLPKTKRVPEEIWGASNKETAAFLSWLFTAEGSVYCGGRGHSGIALAQADVELLRDVQLLLLRFGIHSRIAEMAGATSFLSIRRADAMIKFAEKIGFHTTKKKETLKVLADYARNLTRKLSPRQPWEAVKAIKNAGVMDVYDLEVPQYERFVANGIIVHNTGKSRSVDVIGDLCYKRMKVSGAITPAPIFRIIKKYNGSLIIDESDMEKSDESQAIVKILNCGITKGTPIMRCMKDDPDTLQIFPVFGPKVFATRKRFDDQALESRCLTTIMSESDRQLPSFLAKECSEVRQKLINKLLLFRFRNLSAIPKEMSEKTDINLGDIDGRLKQVCLPFAMIFKDNPETLDKFRTFLTAYQADLRGERADSYQGKIVYALFKAAKSMDKDKVTANAVAGVAKEECNLDISARKVSAILKTMKILIDKPRRVGDKTFRFVIWDNELMRKIYRRYQSGEPDFLDLLGYETIPVDKSNKVTEDFQPGLPDQFT